MQCLQNYIEVIPPKEFSFEQCLVYLNRSELECLHKVKNNELYKLLKLDNIYVLFKIGIVNGIIRATFLNINPQNHIKEQIERYIYNMFDFETDLALFYEKAHNDEILSCLVNKYKGLRIVKISDLFEGLSWAVIGQQINLKFAYTLKKRLVETYGEKLTYEGEDYWIFPNPEKISGLDVDDLRRLQFTQRKAEYVIGIAKLFTDGSINEGQLKLEKAYRSLFNKLISIRGVGNWTADYTIMKCFNINYAFPIADVGIHNALKNILNLREKPSIMYIEKLASNWTGWEAYATFYLWRSLYD